MSEACGCSKRLNTRPGCLLAVVDTWAGTQDRNMASLKMPLLATLVLLAVALQAIKAGEAGGKEGSPEEGGLLAEAGVRHRGIFFM